MRLVLLWLIPIACAGPLQATAIVAALFPDAIYIAADSRLTSTASTGLATASDGCKIFRTPGAAFAAAALSSDSRTGFDFAAIANDALAMASGPLSARISVVERALASPMKKTADAIHQDFPEAYEAFRKGRFAQAVFATWENDRPVLIEDNWNITTDGEIREERSPVNDDKNLVILGSGSEAILRYVDRNPDWWMFPAAEALERLIEAAIRDAGTAAQPDVGGEISILMIDAQGQRWIRPGNCAEAPPDSPR